MVGAKEKNALALIQELTFIFFFKSRSRRKPILREICLYTSSYLE